MVSPFAPKRFATLPKIDGMLMATDSLAGRYHPRENILFVHFPGGAQLAGVTTQSSVIGAPVQIARERIPRGTLYGLIVNAGNANVCTGRIGREDVEQITARFADKIGCSATEILMASTGVIGEMLEKQLFFSAIERLQFSHAQQWQKAARAILTTDTYTKAHSTSVKWQEKTYHIVGIAKGSGMIAPNMATMLAFIITDLPLTSCTLQQFLKQALPSTFNAITVDGDTSTSDMVLAMATGKPPTLLSQAQEKKIYSAFLTVCHELALAIVKDGEGIHKLMKVCVQGAKDDETCRMFARSVANSLLVKTAICGEDLNWGRVAMALGKTGMLLDIDDITISFGDYPIYKKGEIIQRNVAACTAHLRSKEIVLTIDLASGTAGCVYYSTDLSEDYIFINTRYRS